MVQRALIISVAALFLVGCNTTNPLEISTIETRIEIEKPVSPRPVNLSNVNFRVISINNINDLIDEIEQNPDKAWYMITPRDYENMALNIAELRRYIRQQREIIVYYENITSQ